jgi:hypothetical protein
LCKALQAALQIWVILALPRLGLCGAGLAQDGERVLILSRRRFPMRRAVALFALLSLVVLHAPSSAQALMSSFLPDLFPLGTSEPAMLLLTGIALLSLARLGK